jgi:putative hemolysin
LVVANHPFGGIEGLALGLILGSVRPDFRILANYILGRIPELQEIFLLVDPFETTDSPRRSLKGLRQAYRWLDSGGLVALFPAGEVAHLHLRHRDILDPPWLPTVARLVRHAECPVVPVHFSGHNGPLFQLLGMVHPVLRTAMLCREFLAHRGREIHVRVGSPIPYSKLAAAGDDRGMVTLMRRRTEILAERSRSGARAIQPRQTPTEAEELIAPVPADQLAAEIGALPEESFLASAGDQQVWIAEAAAVPGVIREIGRLRELTFREVGEGTGRELDLDRFDDTYLHLFIWQPERREIVGAYRIGRTDQLIEAEGIRGLYTSTLFRFNYRLFDAMGPALEMGRSFIRPEYQRSFSGLLLLWKGIGRYVMHNPEAPILFGPVSISADYRTASQQFIVSFLKSNNFRHEWSRWVRPVRRSAGGRPR